MLTGRVRQARSYGFFPRYSGPLSFLFEPRTPRMGGVMRNRFRALITGVLVVSSAAVAQQRPPQLKTIPDSINFIWKDIEQDFAALAEAMPEHKWSFKPTQGEFKDVRTFGE